MARCSASPTWCASRTCGVLEDAEDRTAARQHDFRQLHVERQLPVAQEEADLGLEGEWHAAPLLQHGALQALDDDFGQGVLPQIELCECDVRLDGLRELQ